MINREILSREHAELDALAEQLLTRANSLVPQLEGLSALRWRLNHVLMVHLAQEDNLLYPLLCASPNASTRRVAARFAGDVGGLAEAYRTYRSEWTFDRAEADWRGFSAATRVVMQALRKRIQREEMELYPLIEKRAA